MGHGLVDARISASEKDLPVIEIVHCGTYIICNIVEPRFFVCDSVSRCGGNKVVVTRFKKGDS